MARTLSTMLELGTPLPKFKLKNTDNLWVDSASLPSDHGVLVAFMCNHCPYVIHILEKMTAVFNEASQNGFATVAINSNDVESYPEDSPAKMKEYAEKYRFAFDYLFDEKQTVAKEFGAVCTPEFYLFDSSKKLVYRGQFDGSRPGNNIEVSGCDLSNALTCLTKGEQVSPAQKPSMGCGIKWKPENEATRLA